MRILLLLAAVVFLHASEIGLLVSDATPFDSEDLLRQLSSPTDITLLRVNNGWEEETLLSCPIPSVVLDYSYSRRLSTRLSEALREVVFICMHQECPESLVQGQLTAEETALGVANYLQSLNCSRVLVAVSATSFYMQLARGLRNSHLSLTQEVFLRPKLSQAEVRQFVGRVLKPAGSAVAALFVDEETGAWLHSALTDFHIYKQGYAYLFSAEALWTVRPPGALYVKDSAAVGAKDRLHYEALILADMLKSVRDNGSYERPKSLALVNIQGSGDVTVTRDSTVRFPGNITSFDMLAKPIIRVSADLTALNFDGSYSSKSDLVSRGTVVGYREANRRIDIMTNLQFALSEVNLGGTKFNKAWAIAQLHNYESIVGVAFNGFGYGATTIAINNLLAEIGKDLPNTSASLSSPLSNATQFPLYLRTSSSGASTVLVMIRFFQLFGWKRAAVIYSDSQGDMDMCKWFQTYGEQFGIEVTNDERKRMLPIDLVSAQTQLNDTVTDIFKSTVRVVVIWHFQAELIAERMYDFGARAGDYVICQTYGLSYTYFRANSVSAHKRKAVFKGALMFYDRYFSGAEGPRVKQLLRAADGKDYDPFSCVYYDSSMLVAHAVSFMLATGLHYESGRELITEMRKTRFNGCIGIVQFEGESNNRRPGDFSVANLHVTGANETVEIVDAALYSPSKVQLFTLFPSLQFPDETSAAFPDSWREDEKCPYLAKDIRESWKGRKVGLAFIALALLITASASTFTWIRWRHYEGEVLREPTPISLEDSLTLISLPIEFVQLIAMGPGLNLHPEISRVEALSVLRIEELVSSPEGVYGKVLYLTLGLVTAHCAILALEVLDLRLRSCGLYNFCEYWWTLLLPFLGRVFFLPCTYALLSVFQCSRAYGESLAESFLDRDCHQVCWSVSHWILAVLAALCLCIQLSLNNFSQLLCQEMQMDLHIKAAPAYLLVRSVMLVAFASSKLFFEKPNLLMHAFLYVCLAAIYALCVFRIKPCNYPRVNLWTRLTLVAVLLYGSVSLCTVQFPAFSTMWAAIALALSFGGLLAVGLSLQLLLPRFRALLVRQKDDRYDIIKFAFTFGHLAQMHLRNFQFKHAGQRYTAHFQADALSVPSPSEVQIT